MASTFQHVDAVTVYMTSASSGPVWDGNSLANLAFSADWVELTQATLTNVHISASNTLNGYQSSITGSSSLVANRIYLAEVVATNTALLTNDFDVSRSTFNECDISTTIASLTRVTMVGKSDSSHFNITGPPETSLLLQYGPSSFTNYTFNLPNAMFAISSPDLTFSYCQLNVASFALGTTLKTFDVTNELKVSNLIMSLASTLNVANLEVKNSIQCQGSLVCNINAIDTPTTSKWSFSSFATIGVRVAIDMTGLDEFEFSFENSDGITVDDDPALLQRIYVNPRNLRMNWLD